MTPWALGHGPNNYPYAWKLPPKPWPQEPDDIEPDDDYVEAAEKAQKTGNQIKKMERLAAKMEEKK